MRSIGLFCRVLLLTFAACAADTQLGFAQQFRPLDETAQRQAVAEYRTALKKLEDRYSHIQLEMTLRESFASQKILNRIEFAANGAMIRAQATQVDDKGLNELEGTHVFLVTPKQAGYSLQRFPRTDKYVIDKASVELQAIRQAIRIDILPACAPYCILGQRIEDLMAEPGFVLKAIESAAQDPNGLLRLSWEGPVKHVANPHQIRIRRFGWFVVRSADTYALQSYESAFAHNNDPFTFSYRVDVEYGERIDGIPIVSKVVEWKETGPERVRSQVRTFENVRAVVQPLPEQAFTLSAFGLQASKTPSRRPLVLIYILAIISGLAAWLFWFLARKKSAKVC